MTDQMKKAEELKKALKACGYLGRFRQEGFEMGFVAGYNSALQTKTDKVQGLVKVLEERCCIDDCGFDVETESIEVLRDCMKRIDIEAREALELYRAYQTDEGV
jgi:hypothetical protein